MSPMWKRGIYHVTLLLGFRLRFARLLMKQKVARPPDMKTKGWTFLPVARGWVKTLLLLLLLLVVLLLLSWLLLLLSWLLLLLSLSLSLSLLIFGGRGGNVTILKLFSDFVHQPPKWNGFDDLWFMVCMVRYESTLCLEGIAPPPFWRLMQQHGDRDVGLTLKSEVLLKPSPQT